MLWFDFNGVVLLLLFFASARHVGDSVFDELFLLTKASCVARKS